MLLADGVGAARRQAAAGAAPLVAVAVELGFRVGCDLRRPSDLGDDDDEMATMVDEIQVPCISVAKLPYCQELRDGGLSTSAGLRD